MVAIAPAQGQRSPSLPPIRPLGPITASASVDDSLKNLYGVRALPGGRVLVNDPIIRRLLLYDSTLSHPTIVMDASNAAVRRYPVRSGGLVAYFGDSSLFVDLSALALLVADPDGKITRLMSLANTAWRNPHGFFVDPRGRVLSIENGYKMIGKPVAGSADTVWVGPDSLPILRDDLLSHRMDTVAYYNIAKKYPDTNSKDADGYVWPSAGINPLPESDGWAELPDGTLAVVRVLDYRIDWISPDGVRSSSPRIPHDWHRYSEAKRLPSSIPCGGRSWHTRELRRG